MNKFLLGWGLIFISALLDSYAAFMVKTQFNKMGAINFSSFSAFFDYLFTFFSSPLLVSALIAFVCAPGIWFIALNKIDLSVGYPILVAFHLLFVLFFGVFFLHELMTLKKCIGAVLVLASLYFFYSK